MNCPKCGTVVNAESKFCGSCGFDLSSINQNTTITEQNSVIPNIQEQTEQLEEPVIIQNNPVNLETNTQAETPVMYEQQNAPGMNAQTPTPMMPEQPMNTTMTNNPSGKNSGNSKTAIIVGIIAILAVIGAIIGFVFLMPKSEEKKEAELINDMFNPNKLIKVKKGDKYGYINSKGKMVLDAKYDTATDFHGNYAVVRAQTEIEGMQTTAYQIIDTRGKVKKQASISIEYLEDSQMWLIDQELYNSSMKKISPEGVRVSEADEGYFVWVNSTENTGGIMNEKGKITYTYKFQSGETYINIEPSDVDESLKEVYCRVNVENNKYAVVNCDTGVVAQDFVTSYISVDSDNIFEISKENSYTTEKTIYIQGDKVVWQTNDSSNVNVSYYPGYLYVRDYSKQYNEGRYTYFHLDTLETKNERPVNTTEEDEELDEWEELTNNKSFSCTTGYGLISDETVTLPCEWESLKYVEINLYKYLKENNKDYIYGKKDNKWYLIDLSTKKAIIEFNTSYIYQEEETTFMYYTDKDTNEKKVYNILTGKSLNVPSGNYLSSYSNYVTVKDNTNKTLKYYNTDLELIYTENL